MGEGVSAELILDIFATRAKSREAKMQAEFAQLETDRRFPYQLRFPFPVSLFTSYMSFS